MININKTIYLFYRTQSSIFTKHNPPQHIFILCSVFFSPLQTHNLLHWFLTLLDVVSWADKGDLCSKKKLYLNLFSWHLFEQPWAVAQCLASWARKLWARVQSPVDGSYILATSAFSLITVVPACLLGLTWAKVTLNSLIHPSLWAVSESKCKIYLLQTIDNCLVILRPIF